MKKAFFVIAAIILVLVFTETCKKGNDNNTAPPIDSTTAVMGYNILGKLPGIWAGPVISTTSLGDFSKWTLDFRPISPSQVSGKTEYDSLNDIFLSFFIVRDGLEYKMAFRNGGSWAGKKRITYELIDSVYETPGYSYYRFVDFVRGAEKTFNAVVFKGDSMIMKAYTNKYNTEPTAVLHMAWSAKRVDSSSTANTISHFNFPKKTMIKDFTSAFAGRTESVWYSYDGDPYPEAEQPYLANAAISYSFTGGLTVDTAKKVFILITTQPLFSGINYDPTALKYLSRYIIVDADYTTCTFSYFHPGSYYLYALYDNDGNGGFSSGDYVSFSNTAFTASEKQTVLASTVINQVVP